MNFHTFRQNCTELQKIIHDNEESFLETFSDMNYSELLHVRFSFELIEFVVLSESGYQVLDYADWDAFQSWVDQKLFVGDSSNGKTQAFEV